MPREIEMPVHVLDDARGLQEEGKTSSEWALIARERVMRRLLEAGSFTADELFSLGIPEHYRKSVHGLVTAYFRGKQPYMEEAGRRKSERPERKGAKNTVFRITAKGRRELPGLLKGLTVGVSAGGMAPRQGESLSRGREKPLAGADPGGQSAPTGVPPSEESGRDTDPSVPSASVQSGEGSGVPSHAPEPDARPYEPLSLLPEPDPEAWAA
jgi:hypothetical protein